MPRTRTCERRVVLAVAALWLSCLSACGGGDGPPRGTQTPPPASASITFDQPGPLALDVGSTLSNVARAPGTGLITYTSSNPGIGSVDNAGVVAGVSAGTVTITASKAADAQFSAATASYSIEVRLQENSLSFVHPGPLTLALGSEFANPASGHGTGAIAYESNGTAVATVNGSGLTKAVGIGTATITATQGPDAQNNGATASYRVSVSVAFTARVGTSDTLVDFPAEANGLNFYRSRSADCDLANLVACEHGQISVLTGSTVTDTAATLDNAATYILEQDMRRATRPVGDPRRFTARSGHQAVVFKDRIWVVAGEDSVDSTNDIWSSADGIVWRRETPTASFTRTSDHKVFVFQDQLWLIRGGQPGTSTPNEIWSSDDGITWTLRSSNVAFSSRSRYDVAVFENRVWLLGGAGTAGSEAGEVWSSTDAVTWTLTVPDAGFSKSNPLVPVRAVVFDDKLWFVDNSLRLWSSNDGMAWQQYPDVTFFSSREGFELVAFDDRLWVIGGWVRDGSVVDDGDAWSSRDGVNWVREASEPAVFGRSGHRVVTFAEKLWVIGGRAFRIDNGYSEGLYDDVWSSSDGSHWRKRAGSAIPPVSDHQLVPFENRLWLLTGTHDNQGPAAPIFSSPDGTSWRRESRHAPFGPQRQASVVLLGNKLWLIAGDEVWSSADGTTWSRQTDNAPFGIREDHQVVVFNGKMWLIGGAQIFPAVPPAVPSSRVLRNDVWSSIDGTTWTLENASASFSARGQHQVIVFKDKLWLFGGNLSVLVPTNDIWSSDDGVNWIQEPDAASFSARVSHQIEEFEGKLVLIGGMDANWNPLNDIWRSTDGITWTQQTSAAVFPPVAGHQLAVFRNRLMLIGGRTDSLRRSNELWSSDDGVNWRIGHEGTIE